MDFFKEDESNYLDSFDELKDSTKEEQIGYLLIKCKDSIGIRQFYKAYRNLLALSYEFSNIMWLDFAKCCESLDYLDDYKVAIKQAAETPLMKKQDLFDFEESVFLGGIYPNKYPNDKEKLYKARSFVSHNEGELAFDYYMMYIEQNILNIDNEEWLEIAESAKNMCRTEEYEAALKRSQNK